MDDATFRSLKYKRNYTYMYIEILISNEDVICQLLLRIIFSSELTLRCSRRQGIPLITSCHKVNFELRPCRTSMYMKVKGKALSALYTVAAVRYGCCDCTGYVERIFQSRSSSGSIQEQANRELNLPVQEVCGSRKLHDRKHAVKRPIRLQHLTLSLFKTHEILLFSPYFHRARFFLFCFLFQLFSFFSFNYVFLSDFFIFKILRYQKILY